MIPATLRAALETHLSTPILAVRGVGGGDINFAAQVKTGSDTYFVKWNPDSPAGMFTAEARGLTLLAQTGTLRVPNVIHYAEASDQVTAFLVLDWFETESSTSQYGFERLGEGLAALHLQTSPTHGLDHANFIGRLPQRNEQTKSWAAFYRDQRIGIQQELARQGERLSAERERLLDKLMLKLPEILPDAPASLLHGDLWGGNYSITANDTPMVYDPAVYYGHREVELAFTELFGGFPARFYQAYQAVYPLDAGYQDRKALYQLYPLLVHLNLFGESYGRRVDEIARHYVA